MVNKVNCNTCLSLVSLFYSPAMSATVREAIVAHLVKCNKCLERYADYESKHPEYKDVQIEKIIKAIRKNKDSYDMIEEAVDEIEITSLTYFDSNTDGNHFNPTKWQDSARLFDIETLMNLKVFRDLINSYDYNRTNTDLDYSGFYKHITKKLAQQVDLLEACFYKETVEHSTVTNS